MRIAYRAADGKGRIRTGTLESSSADAAVGQLAAEGLLAITVKPCAMPASAGGAPQRELAVLFRSLASLTTVGIPLAHAIRHTRPLVGRPLQKLLDDTLDGLANGRPLADSMALCPGLIRESLLAMVRAGERTGRLPAGLERVAQQLEYEVELIGALRQALAYPAFLAVAGVLSMVLLLGFVVPRFALLITDLGQEVPVSTRALLALSSLVHRLGLPALIMAAMAGGALRRVLHRPQYQRHFHRLLLRLPSIGSLRQALASARMLQALSHALSAGMALVPAMMVGQAATTDAAIAERIGQARARVERGETLSHALREERAAAPLGVQLLGVGEATGQLASMAERAARLLQMDVERRLRTLASLAEPILIIAFGLMIACVAAGLLQAVYSLRPAA